MKFRVCKEIKWSSAHRIKGCGGCAALHGHNYRAEVVVSSKVLTGGMVVNFDAFNQLKRRIEQAWDHATILDLMDKEGRAAIEQLGTKVAYTAGEPTVERFAMMLHRIAGETIKNATVERVRVYETEKCWAEYGE